MNIPEIPDKKYFKIGEVGGFVGVESHVLRFWEREFKFIKPYRPSSGQRLYSKNDILNLLALKALLYEQGFTIDGVRKIVAKKGVDYLGNHVRGVDMFLSSRENELQYLAEVKRELGSILSFLREDGPG